MSFYALKDGMDEQTWKDFEGVEPLATHVDGPTQAEIEEVNKRAGVLTEMTMAERMKREEPNLDGPYDQALRAHLKKTGPHARAQATLPERGRVICEEALRTINGERQDQYGNPEDTFTQIGHLWTAYLSRGGYMTMITPPMVADMMCLLKIARENGGKGKRDNAVDLVGYAALAARMRGYDD